MKQVFIATRNSDLSEGRGHPVVIAAFLQEEDAQKAAEGRGVMGGNGEVQTLEVEESYEAWAAQEREATQQQALSKLTDRERASLNM